MRSTTMAKAFERVGVRLRAHSPNQNPEVRQAMLLSVLRGLERFYARGKR